MKFERRIEISLVCKYLLPFFFFFFFFVFPFLVKRQRHIVFAGKRIVLLIILHRCILFHQCASFTFRTRGVSRRMDVLKRGRQAREQAVAVWKDKRSTGGAINLTFRTNLNSPPHLSSLNLYIFPNLITSRDMEKVVNNDTTSYRNLHLPLYYRHN